MEILLGETSIKQVDLEGKEQGVYMGDITIPSGTEGAQDLIIKAIDNEYYAQSISYSINVVKRDADEPIITLTNPPDTSISLYT